MACACSPTRCGGSARSGTGTGWKRRGPATPSQHFSGRTPGSRNSTLWSSLIIRSPRHTLFFSGDTGLTTEYQAIRERFGPFDLVMLEIGAFHPAWGDMHLGPENALKALSFLGGGAFLPIHWGTFALGMHAWDQPAEALLQLVPRARAQLVMPRLGQPVEPAQAEPAEPWWRAAAEGRRPRGLGAVVGSSLPKTLPWPMD